MTDRDAACATRPGMTIRNTENEARNRHFGFIADDHITFSLAYRGLLEADIGRCGSETVREPESRSAEERLHC